MGNGTMYAIRAEKQNIAVDNVDLVPVDLERLLADANGARQVPTLMIFTPQNPDRPIVLTGLYSKAALVETLNAL